MECEVEIHRDFGESAWENCQIFISAGPDSSPGSGDASPGNIHWTKPLTPFGSWKNIREFLFESPMFQGCERSEKFKRKQC